MRGDSFYKRMWNSIYPIIIFMGITLITEFVYMMIVMAVGQMMGYSISMELLYDAVYSHGMLITIIIDLAAACILMFFYQKDKKRIHVPKMQWNVFHVVLLMIMGVAACFGINFTMDILQLNVIFESEANELSSILYSESLVIQLLAMVIAAPLAEELVFRGLIFKRARTYSKFLAASLLTAMLFGLYHGNMLQFIYAFVVSWILTLVYEQFLSLKFCVLVHAVMNATSVWASNSVWFENLVLNEWQYLALTFAADMITILCVLLLLGPMAPKAQNKEEKLK
ncbi:MAG: lysostaphin resistance A-like protein [Lachnospiraceae bacterium]